MYPSESPIGKAAGATVITPYVFIGCSSVSALRRRAISVAVSQKLEMKAMNETIGLLRGASDGLSS